MASKINKGEILAKFFDDGEYTTLFADGAVSAACGYAAGQQAYAVYQNGEAVTVKDVEKNIKVLENGCTDRLPGGHLLQLGRRKAGRGSGCADRQRKAECTDRKGLRRCSAGGRCSGCLRRHPAL